MGLRRPKIESGAFHLLMYIAPKRFLKNSSSSSLSEHKTRVLLFTGLPPGFLVLQSGRKFTESGGPLIFPMT